DIVVGPMLVRALMRPEAELPDGLAEQIVDTVLAGLRPTAP
ncbi:TetR family transcriptional regulator, partial [Streptomyces sp. NPDC005568]